MPKQPVTLTVEVHYEDATFWGQVREYPGCFATGDTFDEFLEDLRQALSVHLDSEVALEHVERVEPPEQQLRVELVTA